MEKRKQPELRFPEFNGEWDKNKLSKFTNFKQGYQIPYNEQIKEKKEGYLRYLYISDFFNDNNLIYVKYDNKINILNKGDIVVANTGNTAGSFYKSKKGILSNNMFSISKSKYFTNEFLYTFLSSDYYTKQLKKFFNSGGQPHLGHKNMGMIQIAFPTLPEQQKIASFLTSVDSKIEKLEKKRELMGEYKRGVMQKIFSQEIRFSDEDGKEYPEWVEKRIGDQAVFISSGKTKVKLEVGPYKLYGSTGVIGYVSEPEYNGTYILIARVGANAGLVNIIDDNCGISDNTLVIKCKNILNSLFLFYVLKNYKLNRLIFGSGQPLITGGQIKKLKFKFPCLEEQEKIANFLSGIDKKIELVEQETEQVKEFKRGLLQQMFV